MSELAGPSGVLVAGAINTDLVTRTKSAPVAGETVTGQSFAIYGGGKGANQAVAVARSGMATSMLGAVGRDRFGEERLAALHGEQIGTYGVVIRDGAASGVALIIVEDSGENRIVYVPGATLTVGSDDARQALEATRPAIVLATLELSGPTLKTLFELARIMGARIIVNAAPEPAAAKDLMSLTDVVVANEVEARQLSGAAIDDSDWPKIGRRLTELGPVTAVITLGAAGAILVEAGDPSWFAPPPVRVVDTTGAGDAFCGALAAALAEGRSTREAVRRAVVAGALATTKLGAQPSIPTGGEITRLLALNAD